MSRTVFIGVQDFSKMRKIFVYMDLFLKERMC